MHVWKQYLEDLPGKNSAASDASDGVAVDTLRGAESSRAVQQTSPCQPAPSGVEAEVLRLREQVKLLSRQAGMAEVATGTLHNVGNVLTSINVSASIVHNGLRQSRIANLSKALLLLREHSDNLAVFLADDPKGKVLPSYLETLAEHLAAEQSEMLLEMDNLAKNLEHVKEIVIMQQSYAKLCGVLETLAPAALVQDALRMNLGAFERHGVTVVRQFAEVPLVTVDKHKVLQILVNLMRNAKYAMDELGPAEKCLTVSIAHKGPERIAISVSDNGSGITRENLARIFNRGFTTKSDGHGFGLNSGFQAARELGGNLTAFSDGPGKGATFCLELPVASNTSQSKLNANGNSNLDSEL
jgi:signal transduction histidine kinase